MKRHVICLGDSNTHGYCGAQEGETLCGGRFSEAERWPCLLQRALGEEYLVIEEGLCGRTTVFPDPLEPGLDAISYLRPCLLSHAPVSLLILMLGTNDTKERFGLSAEEIARGMERLARQAMSEDCWGPGGPDLLVVAPPAIRPEVEHSPVAAAMGRGCAEKSRQLAEHYRRLAARLGARFLDGRAMPSWRPGWVRSSPIRPRGRSGSEKSGRGHREWGPRPFAVE